MEASVCGICYVVGMQNDLENVVFVERRQVGRHDESGDAGVVHVIPVCVLQRRVRENDGHVDLCELDGVPIHA